MDAQNRRLNETRTDQARSHGNRRDLVSFAGLGASHPMGCTGIIARSRSMHLFATTRFQQVLELGKDAAVTEVASARRE